MNITQESRAPPPHAFRAGRAVDPRGRRTPCAPCAACQGADTDPKGSPRAYSFHLHRVRTVSRSRRTLSAAEAVDAERRRRRSTRERVTVASSAAPQAAPPQSREQGSYARLLSSRRPSSRRCGRVRPCIAPLAAFHRRRSAPTCAPPRAPIAVLSRQNLVGDEGSPTRPLGHQAVALRLRTGHHTSHPKCMRNRRALAG